MTEQRDPRPSRSDRDDWRERLDDRRAYVETHHGVDADELEAQDDWEPDADAIAAELDDLDPADVVTDCDSRPEILDEDVDGTLVLVGDDWHHSTAFDGYKHTTACDVELSCVAVDDVEMNVLEALDDLEDDDFCSVCRRHVRDARRDLA